MSIFGRLRGRASGPSTGAGLTEELRAALPPGFEAAGEALAAGSDSVIEACWEVGRVLAEQGAPLGECLERLRLTTQLVGHRDPSFCETHALSTAWSDATLGYLHRLSCADPVTGLSTQAHVRERLTEIYRRADDPRSHALVVTEAKTRLPVGHDPIAAARRLALLGQQARTVFPGPETIGQVGVSRLVVLASRDDVLGRRVSLYKRMVADQADRVWIEGLPGTDESAGHLLDELARGA